MTADPTDSAVQALAEAMRAEGVPYFGLHSARAVLSSAAFHAAVQAEVARRVGAVRPKSHKRSCFPYEVTYVRDNGMRVRGPRYGSRETAERATAAVKARNGYHEVIINQKPCTCGLEPADD